MIFYVETPEGHPIIIASARENFLTTAEELTAPGFLKTTTNKANALISDVTERGTVKINMRPAEFEAMREQIVIKRGGRGDRHQIALLSLQGTLNMTDQ